MRLLVANRGEVAVRIVRTARELGAHTVAVHSQDDALGLHVRLADEAVPLAGSGPLAYLDAERLVDIARRKGCDMLHPGYGFLSESAEFARRCAQAGVRFVGPRPDTLEVLGDKPRARTVAARAGVPVLEGTGTATLDDATAFLDVHGAVVIKAVFGGGGRGMRVVRDPASLADAYAHARAEAEHAFGKPDVYVERLAERARHVEVQVFGDATGAVAHLGERECTLQRRHQKLVEVAPAPHLDDDLRRSLWDAALRLAEAVELEGAATFEFLVDAGRIHFIEANPRLQVEHTVTEQVTGVDIVAVQLELASGRTLAGLGLGGAVFAPLGCAIEIRINAETMGTDGSPRPASGTLTAFEVPSGPGVRVDTAAHAGYAVNPRFDSLLAKLVVHTSAAGLGAALTRARRALGEFVVEGAATNIGFLRRLLDHPDVSAWQVDTRFVEEHAAELVPDERAGLAGARIDPVDPLAVLEHGKTATADNTSHTAATSPEGTVAVVAPVQGTVVSVAVEEGDLVAAGRIVAVMEAMKMEHVVPAPVAGVVRLVAVVKGDTVYEGHALAYLEPADVEASGADADDDVDPDAVRRDLAEVLERHQAGTDASRPDAVERRRATSQRTARENVEDLCDPGSFVEYGPVVIAAQRRRRSIEDLIARTPADGMLAGTGRVNGDLFGPQRSRCVVMAYDYTVLAGTQGMQNHRKKDRLFELAERSRLPLVFFTEGGGGRPGDTDGSGVAGLDVMAFHLFGRLSGLVPLVGVNSGRCFAGNAALLGCCDVVIATQNSTIGMGGPAMIEGGGLGVFRPEEVGPMAVQVPSGVVDIAVADEAEAVAVAKQYLSYFQGAVTGWSCADQRRLRLVIPENRLRVYDVRAALTTLADTGSVLELRRGFGTGMVTALARIEGRPIGVIANNPTHLAGAIDSNGADKAARFMQLCDAFDLPILFLCDTPGIMVGPEAEKTALVRHASRLFVTGANLTVPFFTIVLRKAYGLGAQAMAGGSFKAPVFAVSWPTGEFGGMGLEGAVKLGYRNELAAVEDPAERKALFDQMVARMYERGKALNTASHFEIDDVIDPTDSRRWITAGLDAGSARERDSRKKRPSIDTW